MNWKRPFRPFRSITIHPRRPANCPHCTAEIAGALEIGPARAKAGSFTICWQCETLLRFDDSLQLRNLTDADKRVLDLHPATRAELNELRITIAVSRTIRFPNLGAEPR